MPITPLQEQILAEMKPVKDRARREGLMLRGKYQDLWFTPDELNDEQKRGHFLWGTPNWTLEDPKVRLAQLKSEVAEAQVRHDLFLDRVRRYTLAVKQAACNHHFRPSDPMSVQVCIKCDLEHPARPDQRPVRPVGL